MKKHETRNEILNPFKSIYRFSKYTDFFLNDCIIMQRLHLGLGNIFLTVFRKICGKGRTKAFSLSLVPIVPLVLILFTFPTRVVFFFFFV